MKRAIFLFAAALTLALLTGQAHAAGLCPVSDETYTYGPFDELRIDKVYELSRFDDPADIPTDDFDRDGYHYTLLCVVTTDQGETENEGQAAVADRDTVVYTATFACQGKTQSNLKPSQDQLEGASNFDLRLLIILPLLFGIMGLVFGGKSVYEYIQSKKGV